MGESKHDGFAVPGRVVLAHEPPFQLGCLAVDPATRQVAAGGSSETLEPRVMQVLVALTRADGRIVTRDELTMWCWDGRIVGEDAINRVLSRLRRLAADFGECSFTIETITKVGYRLVITGARTGPSTNIAKAPSTIDRRFVLGGAAAAIAGIGGAMLWPGANPRPNVSPESKKLYEQALAIRPNGSAAEVRQALAYLRESVRLSPEYGEAWGALALTYRAVIDDEPPERVVGFEDRLREAVHNARKYDPGNADAAVALLPNGPWFGRWGQFEHIYRAASLQHPRHAGGHALLGSVLMDVGRWTDATSAFQSAKTRAPSAAIIRYKLIVSLWSAGRIGAADNEIDEAMKLWPQHGAIWQTKIKVLSLTGRAGEALALAGNLAARPIEDADAPDMAARMLLLKALETRAPADVNRAAQSQIVSARNHVPNRLAAALNLAALGRIDTALAILEGAFLGTGEWAAPRASKPWLATHPLFQPHARPLWREPRFDRILAHVGLERYWRQSGTLPDYRR